MAQRILIVDDEVSMMEILEWELQDCGYEVCCAENGLEALKIATLQEFDLIVSDLLMPQMDGKSFLKELRKIKGLMPPAVLTTGNTKDLDDQILGELGIVRLVAKPYSPEVISKIAQEILGTAKGKV